MNEGGWSCPHERAWICDIIKKECDPGDKGCVLYGKVKFANPDTPSNETFEKRMERKMKKMLKKEKKE